MKCYQGQNTLDGKEICPLPPCGCGHRNIQYKYGCDKEDKECVMRVIETFKEIERKEQNDNN